MRAPTDVARLDGHRLATVRRDHNLACEEVRASARSACRLGRQRSALLRSVKIATTTASH